MVSIYHTTEQTNVLKSFTRYQPWLQLTMQTSGGGSLSRAVLRVCVRISPSLVTGFFIGIRKITT